MFYLYVAADKLHSKELTEKLKKLLPEYKD
jgi:hypothetical protein